MGNLCRSCFQSENEVPPAKVPLVSDEVSMHKETNKKLSVDDFIISKLLGKGAFAKVFLVQKKSDSKFFAMKVLKKRDKLANQEINHILSERAILENCKSPFIVELKYAFQNTRKLYMVMEFMPGGELFFHLSKQKRFNDEVAKFYIAEVIIGIEYLHGQGIIYRDLKPENILLGLDGHIKLTDFGLSKVVSDNEFKTRTMCGTPEYQAPEIIMNCEYDKTVDFWSIGCLLYELISGIPPFYDNDREILKNKILSDPIPFSRIFSESSRNLIDKLLVKNPEFRLSDFRRLKSHEFFDGLNWEEIAKKKVNPPYKPPSGGILGEIQNFDAEFTTENPMSANMSPSPTSQLCNFPGFTYKDPELS